MTKMTNFERAGENLLEAIAYGDAAGLPVESLTSEQIEKMHGLVSRLLAPVDHPMFANEELPGVWSDDTQLSLAVAESLIEADGFDIDSQAEHFIDAYKNTPRVIFEGTEIPRGWGGSTIRSAERIISGVSPQVSGEQDGSGNGVIMKLAPLVYWQAAGNIDAEERYAQYDQLTCMTHLGERALWASRVHGDMLLALLTDEQGYERPSNYVDMVLESSRDHESALDLDSEGTDLLSYLKLPQLTDDMDVIKEHTDGLGFYAPQTLAMAYGIFMYHAYDFQHAVFQAVNLGGDTDSIASIVATLWNFYEKDEFSLPEDHELLVDHRRIVTTSKLFTDKALGRTP